jgi:hypothetical protein
MAAFTRQSGGNPWIPFSRDLKTTNAIEKEEHAIFDEKASQYQRNAAPSSAYGYNKFQTWWNREAADRWTKSIEDEAVILIRPKSVPNLQAHYDFLQEISRQAVQATENNETENARRQMCRTLNQSRRAVEGRIAIMPATPLVYPAVEPGTFQFVPIGAAMMQPQIFAPALSMIQAATATTRAAATGNAAPWVMLQQPPPQQHIGPPSPKRARTRCDWRNLCPACGWPKRQHSKINGRLHVADDCVQTICGICNRSKGEHDRHAIISNKPTGRKYSYMGKNCIFTTYS